METPPDATAISAAFAQPNNDGTYPDAFASYLAQLGLRREAVILAFPPKAAGTFLRTAAITAVNGQLVRIVHAQGGRDAQPYLPILISYFSGGLCRGVLVTHVHMQALAANRALIEVLDLKPIVMLRSIPDMLASYWDMLEHDKAALSEGLNCHIPANFTEMSASQKGDFLIDILGPWYCSYYATWLEYFDQDPERVCLLNYRDFLSDPASALEAALHHSRLTLPRARCEAAIACAWSERNSLRFNCGEDGRGKTYFSAVQLERLVRMISHFPALSQWRSVLVEPCSSMGSFPLPANLAAISG
jgi:hypothetical protein